MHIMGVQCMVMSTISYMHAPVLRCLMNVLLYLQGDVASCAGTYVHVWSINGEEIACVNTASFRNHQILCVAMSQVGISRNQV